MNLKRLLRSYYEQQLQKEADDYWAEGKICTPYLINNATQSAQLAICVNMGNETYSTANVYLTAV